LPFAGGRAAHRATVKLNVGTLPGRTLPQHPPVFLQSKAIFLLCSNACPPAGGHRSDRRTTWTSMRTSGAASVLARTGGGGHAPGMEGRPPVERSAPGGSRRGIPIMLPISAKVARLWLAWTACPYQRNGLEAGRTETWLEQAAKVSARAAS
jgi:hypothetical protein